MHCVVVKHFKHAVLFIHTHHLFTFIVMNGNSGVARSAVSELTDDTNKAKAFAIFGFSYGMGIIGK